MPSNWPDTRYLCSGVIEGLYEQEPDKLQVSVWLSFVTSQHDRCFHSQGCTQNQIEAQRTGSIWNGGAAAGARSDFCKKVGASDITLAPTWWSERNGRRTLFCNGYRGFLCDSPVHPEHSHKVNQQKNSRRSPHTDYAGSFQHITGPVSRCSLTTAFRSHSRRRTSQSTRPHRPRLPPSHTWTAFQG